VGQDLYYIPTCLQFCYCPSHADSIGDTSHTDMISQWESMSARTYSLLRTDGLIKPPVWRGISMRGMRFCFRKQLSIGFAQKLELYIRVADSVSLVYLKLLDAKKVQMYLTRTPEIRSASQLWCCRTHFDTQFNRCSDIYQGHKYCVDVALEISIIKASGSRIKTTRWHVLNLVASVVSRAVGHERQW